MKKVINILVVSAILLMSFITPYANDFAGNEAYYEELCKTQESIDANKETCVAFSQYLSDKADNSYDEADKLQEEIDKLEGNISEQVKKIKDIEEVIAKLDIQIKALEEDIKEKEANIVLLEEQIVIREENINRIDLAIQERMVVAQSNTTLNTYIDFIMGAENFIDLIGRMEVLNDIAEYDRKQMELMESEIEALSEDKAILAREKLEIESDKNQIEISKGDQIKLMKTAEDLKNSYLSQEADLLAQLNRVHTDLNDILDKMNGIAEALGEVVPSKGWTRPIASGYRKSAEAWYYPSSFGGGVHLGVDLAASVGTELRAAGNGVVIASADSCDTYGYLGSTCGKPGSGGGGNQVYLMINVNGKIYAVKYLHMKQGTPIAAGQTVTAGQKIGEVGNSGNSSGAHVHVEVFYLGTRSLEYYATNWDGDLAFGAGWGSAALNKTCSATGGVAPCRETPQDIFGL